MRTIGNNTIASIRFLSSFHVIFFRRRVFQNVYNQEQQNQITAGWHARLFSRRYHSRFAFRPRHRRISIRPWHRK